MIGIIIVARLGSSRLPGKHLLKIRDKTMMEWLILRIKNQFLINQEYKIIIATSSQPENKNFEFLKKIFNNVEVFYGSNGNIPLRLLDCAKEYNLSKLICIGGDNPLSSIKGCNLIANELDNYEYVETQGLPIGMNVFGFTFDSLLKNLTEEYLKKEDLEFAWNLIFKDIKYITLGKYDIKDTNLRITLDYEEDYRFFKQLIEFLHSKTIISSDNEIINTIKLHNFNQINNHLGQKYWKNFNEGKINTHKEL